MKIGRMVAGASALMVTGLLALPGVAAAHTADAAATCDGLTVTVQLYPEGVTTTIEIDGRTIVREGGVNETIPWSSSADHTWSVHVDGVAEGTDRDFGDTHRACVVTTTTELATTTTQPPAVTTTQPPAVTTTQPPTVTTTLTEVTQVLQEATTTTTTPAATTTTVAGSSGSGTTGQGGGTLPATGPVTAPLVGVAAVALVAGGALLLVARRRSAD